MIITIVIVTIIKEPRGESVYHILQSAAVSVCVCVCVYVYVVVEE